MLVFQQISGFAGKNEKNHTEKGGLRSIFSWVTGKFLQKLVYS